MHLFVYHYVAHPTPGGTTACVVAGRLTATDPSLRILIIESGQHSRDVPSHVQPCRYVQHLAPDSTTLSPYIAKPSTHLNGRGIAVACGRGVGGGSTVNCKLQAANCASPCFIPFVPYDSYHSSAWSLSWIQSCCTFEVLHRTTMIGPPLETKVGASMKSSLLLER